MGGGGTACRTLAGARRADVVCRRVHPRNSARACQRLHKRVAHRGSDVLRHVSWLDDDRGFRSWRLDTRRTAVAASHRAGTSCTGNDAVDVGGVGLLAKLTQMRRAADRQWKSAQLLSRGPCEVQYIAFVEAQTRHLKVSADVHEWTAAAIGVEVLAARHVVSEELPRVNVSVVVAIASKREAAAGSEARAAPRALACGHGSGPWLVAPSGS